MRDLLRCIPTYTSHKVLYMVFGVLYRTSGEREISSEDQQYALELELARKKNRPQKPRSERKLTILAHFEAKSAKIRSQKLIHLKKLLF